MNSLQPCWKKLAREAVAIQLKLDSPHGIAELWVPHDTPEDAVQNIIHTYQNTHRVVVFRSGAKDLLTATQDLIKIQKT